MLRFKLKESILVLVLNVRPDNDTPIHLVAVLSTCHHHVTTMNFATSLPLYTRQSFHQGGVKLTPPLKMLDSMRDHSVTFPKQPAIDTCLPVVKMFIDQRLGIR